jgi:hypothetical protein
MERKGTVGAFTKQATRAGMSVQDFAQRVLNEPERFTKRTRKRAQFAVNMQKIADKRRLHNPGCLCISCS